MTDLRKIDGRHRALMVVVGVLAACSVATYAASVYLGQTTIDRLSKLDARLAVSRLVLPGEEAHVRAARVLRAASERRQAEALLELCRLVSLVSGFVLAAAVVAMVAFHGSASGQPYDGARGGTTVFRIVPGERGARPSRRPSAVTYYTPETCVTRPA